MSPFFRFVLLRYLGTPLKPGSAKLGNTVSSGLIIPMCGVAAGVFSFIVVLSIMGGFVQGLRTRLLSLEAHMEVVPLDEKGGKKFIDADTTLLESIETWGKKQGIELGAVPVLKAEAVVRSTARASTGILMGIDPVRAHTHLAWRAFLSQSTLLPLNDDTTPTGSLHSDRFASAILGQELARQFLRVEPGDRLTLLSPIPEEGPGGLAPTQIPVVVVDEINSQQGLVDSKWIVVSIKTAQQFLDLPNQWSSIFISMGDPMEAERVSARLSEHLHENDLRVKPWTENNKALLRALRLERWGMSFVTFVILLVGCFSITITLVLSVKRKSREMAILRALGLNKNQLSLLYLTQGTCVGALGTGTGLALAFGTLGLLKRFPIPIAAFSYGNRPLPVLTQPLDVIVICLGALTLACLAALWPAWEVGRINVVDTIGERQ